MSDEVTERTDEHVGFALRLAYQRASANLTEAIGAHGLTPMQFQTLWSLHKRGPITQNELGRGVGMPPANIHTIVRQLVSAGLVATTSTPKDRRVAVVTLTDAGRERLRDVLPVAAAANARTVSVLSVDEQDQVMRLLWRLAEA